MAQLEGHAHEAFSDAVTSERDATCSGEQFAHVLWVVAHQMSWRGPAQDHYILNLPEQVTCGLPVQSGFQPGVAEDFDPKGWASVSSSKKTMLAFTPCGGPCLLAFVVL